MMELHDGMMIATAKVRHASFDLDSRLGVIKAKDLSYWRAEENGKCSLRMLLAAQLILIVARCA